ncbi:MAG: metal-dependent transcriptional regulator [bacterium]|nr:metal-dependent transcriptional regulator [bacterium]
MPKEMLAETTSPPELASTSESEQMYLITVARAAEAGNEGPVAISKIADALDVSVPSANEMVRKLDNRGLLVYEPYHGVLLTDLGRRIADQVLRTRRLWATFLAEHLGFSPTDADEQACDLEHSTTPEAADRLAVFLGNPAAGPLGMRIPDATEHAEPVADLRLADLSVGAEAEVTSLAASGRILDFLTTEGITVGARVTVTASGTSGVLVVTDTGDMHLDGAVAATVAVQTIGGRNVPA